MGEILENQGENQHQKNHLFVVVNYGGKQCWINFKYERLSKFCFKCDILKHENGRCSQQNLVPHNQEQDGQWLCAPSSPSSGTELRRHGGSSKHSSHSTERRSDGDLTMQLVKMSNKAIPTQKRKKMRNPQKRTAVIIDLPMLNAMTMERL